jgi:hypothetical protein
MTGLELLDEIGIVLAVAFVGGCVATKLRLPPLSASSLPGWRWDHTHRASSPNSRSHGSSGISASPS